VPDTRAATGRQDSVPPTVPLTAAIALAARGFAVFPLRADAKTPAVDKDWAGQATVDPVRIRRLFRAGRSNIGIACGPSNLVVIDLDVAKADSDTPRHGAEALRDLADGRDLPATFTVTTPTGGLHLYFRAPGGPALRNTAGRLGPLIDTRAAGGYVVAPGSTISGVPYQVTADVPIAPLPGWLLGEIRALYRTAAQPVPSTSPVFRSDGSVAAYAAAALHGEIDRVRAARPGTRNDTLNRAAFSLGQLVGAGHLDRELASSELQHAGRHIGLSSGEAAATVRSGLTAGALRPRRIPSAADRVDSSAARLVSGRPVSPASPTGPTSPTGPARTGPAPASGPAPGGATHAADAGWDDWEQILADHAALRPAVQAVRMELAACGIDAGEHVWGAGADRQATGAEAQADANALPDGSLVDILCAVDDAYDSAALSAAPLARTPEWRHIRALADVLRDLRDEIQYGTQDYARSLRDDTRLHAALRGLAACTCRQVSELIYGIANRQSVRTVPNSPIRASLRRLRRAVDTASVDLLGSSRSA
jgi:hypothetical protein